MTTPNKTPVSVPAPFTPAHSVLSDVQILINILSFQFALQPALASTIQSIAYLHKNLVPVIFMSNMNSEAINLSILYNAVACGFTITDYHHYSETALAEIQNHRLFLSSCPVSPQVPPAVPDFFPQPFPIPQDIDCFPPPSDPITASAWEQWIEDLTREGIEPNPGPADIRPQFNTEDEPAPPPAPAPIPIQPQGIFTLIFAALRMMTFFQQVYFLSAMPITCTYAFTFLFLNAHFPTIFNVNPVMPPILVRIFHFTIYSTISYFLAKALIQMLLLMAGIESNPGPNQSDPARPRESSNTQSVDPIAVQDKLTSRSSEKRNSKFSKAYLSSLLETQRREKTLTLVRSAQRAYKNDPWHYESPSRPIVPHNNRRLEKFLETKEVIHPNSFIRLLKKASIHCCRPKDDQIFNFLVSRCHLDEFVALALTPVINTIIKILTNKVTVGIALTILAYYIAKYVSVPIIVLTDRKSVV